MEAAFGGREVKAAWDGQNRPKKGAWARVGLLGCEGRALGCWRDPSPDRLCDHICLLAMQMDYGPGWA